MKARIGKCLLAVAMTATVLPSTGISFQINAADAQFAGEEWYDQIKTVQVNREKAHANFIPYQDAETALANEQSVFTKDLSRSTYYQSLNGEWDFAFAEKPANRLSDPDDQKIEWSGLDKKIQVPSSVEVQKDENGDFMYATPVYTNTPYPWGNYESVAYNDDMGKNAKAPTVKNGVSHFQRTFTTDTSWEGRQVFISFQGVESAFYLYINGQKVGYSEDSYTADDFNITDYLNPAGEENTISVQVYRWSTGSYLENQDFIRLSGIFRDVYLYSKDTAEIRDFFVKPSLNDDLTEGTLDIDVDVRNLKGVSKDMSVEVQLYPIDVDTPLLSEPITMDYALNEAKTGSDLINDEGSRKSGSATIDNSALWSTDNPNLYRVLIQLKDADGNVVETICQKIGFRKIANVQINEEGQYQLQLNNEKVMIRGTNRHESSLYNGRAITFDEISSDLLMMKRNNLNGIRTSHYPNNVWTYELADELGIYMCDEANIESHQGEQHSHLPSGQPVWDDAVMDRTKNMVERDKNHSSVIIWSLGNEATYYTYPMNDNYCFFNTTRWILQRDPSRIRKYERDNRYSVNADKTLNRENSMVDIYSSQYWSVSNIVGHVNNKNNKLPYIQSEYAHGMGNSIGNLKEYWDVFRENENAQGGFIWDWIDQSVLTTAHSSTSYKVVDKKHNLNGTINGELLEGRNGTKALDGTLVLPNNASLIAKSNEGSTLDAWVKMEPGTSLNGDLPVLSKGDSGYNLKIKNGKFEIFFNGYAKGVISPAIPADFTDGTWKRLTATVDKAGYFYLYYNGELLEKGSKSMAVAPFDTNSMAIGVGYDSEFTSRVWPGAIDSVRVLNTCLDADQIAAGMVSSTEDSVVYAMDFAEDELHVTGETPEAEYWGYGGDWDDKALNDHNFCANGIINADRSESAKLIDVKKVLQEVNFYNDGDIMNGNVRLVNELPSTDLSDYTITWSLQKNGTEIANGDASTSLEAQSEKVLHIDLPDFGEVRDGDDYYLNFKVMSKYDKEWAEAGHVVATEQLALSPNATIKKPTISASEMETFKNIEETEDTLHIEGSNDGNDFSITLDKNTGYISDYTYAGTKLMEEGPVPNYYRAIIDNDKDGGIKIDPNLMNTKDNYTVTSFDIQQAEKFIQVTVKGNITTATPSPDTITYTIFSNGEVNVNNNVNLNSSQALTRVGMKMSIPKEFSNFTYYGRGPWENYIDRNTGSHVGLYETTVKEIESLNKYIRPQENGNHTDVKFAAVRNAEGAGFMVAAQDTMSTSLSEYEDEDMSAARHMFQVPKADHLVFNVDQIQRGLGGASCGPGPLGKYILNNGNYSHTFRIVPFTTADNNELMEESKKELNSMNPVKDIKIAGGDFTFDPMKDEFTVKVLKGTFTGAPKIEVIKMSDDAVVEFEQPTSLPARVEVKAKSGFGIEKTYIINIEETEEIYLSDMPWTVDKGGYFENIRDASGEGGKIAVYVDGKVETFEKGVGAHAPSTIEVDIEGRKFTKFQAIVGVNASQAPSKASDLTFNVLVDGVNKYSQRVKAGQSFPCEVDVTGAKTVTFYADDHGFDANDHATWADAKFINDGEDAPVEDTALIKGILSSAIDKADKAVANETFNKLAPAVQEMVTVALDEAKAVLATETTNEAYIAAWLKLANAMQYLDFKADKEDLKALIDQAEALNLEEYIAGVEAFEEALENAKAVYNDKKALQARIDDAMTKLETAMSALVKDENTAKAMLRAMVEKTSALDSTLYRQNQAWEDLQTAITEANKVLANADASAEALHAAILQLSSAYEDIRLLPNEEMLKDLATFIEKVAGLDMTQYSAENAARIKATSARARMMLNDHNLYEDAIQDEIKMVNAIIDEEVITPAPTTPDAPNTAPEEPSETTAPTTPKVEGTTKPGTTKTGDATNMMAMMGMLLASGTGVYTANKKRKAKK